MIPALCGSLLRRLRFVPSSLQRTIPDELSADGCLMTADDVCHLLLRMTGSLQCFELITL
jgi:hypothetical protein